MEEFNRAIANEDLRPEQVPSPEADWPTIWKFAATFNGYKHWGSFERCVAIAEAQAPQTLTELRTCLFMESRRFHHRGDRPDGDEERHIRDLVARIKRCVSAGEFA